MTNVNQCNSKTKFQILTLYRQKYIETSNTHNLVTHNKKKMVLENEQK